MSAKIWIGRDNVIKIQLLEDGARIADHTTITRVQVDLDEGTTVLDSSTQPTWFDLTNTDKIIFNFGLVTGVTAGNYVSEVVVYSADYANGLIWVEDFGIEFE